MPYTSSRAEESHENKDSHPDEGAFDWECEVKDISLFVYSGSKGLNSDADTPIMESFYLSRDNFDFVQDGTEINIEVRSRTYPVSPGDRVAAVINMGNLTRFKTLGELQEYIPSATWTAGEDLSEYSEFTMANASSDDGVFNSYPGNVGKPGSKENPLTTSLNVERTAARIDLNYSGSSRQDDFLVYPAKLSDGTEVATVYVSHVLPVNAMQKGSYALKRITESVSDNLGCFDRYTFTGILPKDADGHPKAYVLEPHTKSKALPLNNADTWYGNTAASNIKELGHGYFTDDKKLSLNLDNEEINSTSNKNVVLAYANENTQHINNHYAECLTGLVIRAQYVPYIVYTKSDLSETVTNPKRGDNIWRYTPRNTTSTEEDVIYFSSEEAALEYSHNHTTDRAEIKSFPEGICYYNLWIRHTVLAEGKQPNNPVFPMEYGIVRNHIYRVSIGFRGIGREGVTIEDPWNIEPQIFVRPWNMKTHPEIIM